MHFYQQSIFGLFYIAIVEMLQDYFKNHVVLYQKIAFNHAKMNLCRFVL